MLRQRDGRCLPVLAGVGGIAFFLAMTVAQAQKPAFSVPDRTLFAEYRALDRDRVALIVAVEPGRAANLVRDLESRGVTVLGRRDAIGYLYLTVPIDLVALLPALDGVQAVQLMATPTRADVSDEPPAKDAGAAAKTEAPRGVPPSSSLSADNPYTGESATQALGFKAKHPTFDGRGVVIAYVEPAAPNLVTMRGALDSKGKPVPKFARYDLGRPVEVADVIADSRDIWQRTEKVDAQADGRFLWRGRGYSLPTGFAANAAEWRICRRLPDGYGMTQQTYDILWAVDEQRVWVLPMTEGSDFSAARTASLRDAVPWVAVGEEAERRKDNRGMQAFVFQQQRERRWLAIAATHNFHAGMVGAVMAGAGFFDSKANGIAPASQVAIYHASMRGAPSLAGVEVQLAALIDPGVDLAQASYAIGDTARFNRTAAFTLWAERVIASNGRPFVKAIGNYGPRLFGSDEFSNAPSVFAVGGYTPRATWLANFGIETQLEHTLASYSGWGPADDGGLKPDFLSLTHTVSEGVGIRWYWRDTPGYEQYVVSGGTSAGAPHGAGHIALLIGAGKQENIPHDAPRLRAAIATTSKFLEGVPARAQGHGLIQVEDAWAALRRAENWQPPSFVFEAPLVGAEIGPRGAQRGVGRGLFELSGWRPGQNGRRELKVTRTGGVAGVARYTLRWKGSVEAFGVARAQIDLPLNEPVTVPVDIQVRDSGGYSAILDFIDPNVNLVAGSILCTIVVADDLPTDGKPLRYTRAAPRLGSELFYVRVPDGVASLAVNIQKDTGMAKWFAQDPTGRVMPYDGLHGTELARPFDFEEMKRTQLTFTYPDPVPGVWQFWLQGAEPRTGESFLSTPDWSRPMPLEVEIRAITAQPATALAQAKPARLTVRPGLEPTFVELKVDAGAKTLRLQMEHADPHAHVGLYIYKLPPPDKREKLLSGDETALIYYDSSLQRRKVYELASPPPGIYRIAVDPIRVPERGVEVGLIY